MHWLEPMPGRAEDALHTFPARPLRADERELVAEWLAAATDVSSAFVSERRTDDPAIHRRIAISVEGDGAFTHFIHTPVHSDVWIVLNVQYRPEIHQFGSLLEALNFIRPVLTWSSPWTDDRPETPDHGRNEARSPIGQDLERRHADRPQLDFHAAE